MNRPRAKSVLGTVLGVILGLLAAVCTYVPIHLVIWRRGYEYFTTLMLLSVFMALGGVAGAYLSSGSRNSNKTLRSTIGVLLMCLVVPLWISAHMPPFSFWKATLLADRIEIERPEMEISDYKSTTVYPSKTIILTGEEARKAARSFQFAWCIGNTSCLSDARVRFYHGAGLVTEAGMCPKLLLISDKWYAPGPSGETLLRSWSDQLRQSY